LHARSPAGRRQQNAGSENSFPTNPFERDGQCRPDDAASPERGKAMQIEGDLTRRTRRARNVYGYSTSLSASVTTARSSFQAASVS
jgi:hypothetical protein